MYNVTCILNALLFCYFDNEWRRLSYAFPEDVYVRRLKPQATFTLYVFCVLRNDSLVSGVCATANL